MWVGSGDSPALQWQPDPGQSSVLGTAGGDNRGRHGTGSVRKQGKATAYLVISFVIVRKPLFSLGKITRIVLTTEWQPDNSVLICSGKSIYQDKLAVGSSGNTCARVQRDWVHAHACVPGGEFMCPCRVSPAWGQSGWGLSVPVLVPRKEPRLWRRMLCKLCSSILFLLVYLDSASLFCGQLVLVSRYLELIIWSVPGHSWLLCPPADSLVLPFWSSVHLLRIYLQNALK